MVCIGTNGIHDHFSECDQGLVKAEKHVWVNNIFHKRRVWMMTLEEGEGRDISFGITTSTYK